MHRMECLHLAYACIEIHNKSYVWAVGSFEWGTWRNVLRDRLGNLRFVFSLKSSSSHFIFFCCFCNKSSHSPTLFLYFITWSVVTDGSDSSSQKLYEYALWSSGGFSGAGYFLWGPQVCNQLGPNRWTGLPWKMVSALPAKPTTHFDPVTPRLYSTSSLSQFSCVKLMVCMCVW